MSGLRILSQSLKDEPYNCQNLVNNSFCPDRGGSVFRIKVPLVVTILLVWIWFQWKKVDKKVYTNTNCGEKPGNGERKKEKKFIMDSTNTFLAPTSIAEHLWLLHFWGQRTSSISWFISICVTVNDRGIAHALDRAGWTLALIRLLV